MLSFSLTHAQHACTYMGTDSCTLIPTNTPHTYSHINGHIYCILSLSPSPSLYFFLLCLFICLCVSHFVSLSLYHIHTHTQLWIDIINDVEWERKGIVLSIQTRKFWKVNQNDCLTECLLNVNWQAGQADP